MTRAKRLCGMITLTGLMTFLCACSLLPAEEAVRSVPLFVNYPEEEYQYTTVQRGDLQVKKMFTSRCVPTTEETYSFKVGGIDIAAVYVKIGDSVKAGDLLCSLSLDGIDETAEEYRLELEKLKLEQAYVEDLIQLTAQKYELTEGTDPATSLAKAKSTYAARKHRIEEAVSIMQISLDETAAEKQKRQIFATIDGTVRYIKQYNKNSKSVAGEAVVTVIDSEMTFQADTKEWQRLPVGADCNMTINGVEYIGTILESTETGEEGMRHLSIALPPGTQSFAQGTRAMITVITEEAADCLYLPSMAITSAGEDNIVYVEEGGVRRMKKVVTGFETDSKTEIISGLSEGDLVIMG